MLALKSVESLFIGSEEYIEESIGDLTKPALETYAQTCRENDIFSPFCNKVTEVFSRSLFPRKASLPRKSALKKEVMEHGTMKV